MYDSFAKETYNFIDPTNRSQPKTTFLHVGSNNDIETEGQRSTETNAERD